MLASNLLLVASILMDVPTIGAAQFNPMHHLGGNGQWFPGTNMFGISSDVPEGCTVDQAAFISRHGSRYPDPGAYQEWMDLSEKIHGTSFKTHTKELEFLHSWRPVLSDPDQQLSQVSITGHKELYDMGLSYRFRYPDLYRDNTNFTLWANYYAAAPRVRDSARLFARGYMGTNSTFGNVYALNATDPRSVANSLAASDLCPLYSDNGGGSYATEWANIYLPPITERINKLLSGLAFDASDVSIFPYLCGYETQITGRRSPWCSVFKEEEILQYEYAQDIRYWYGAGLGTDIEWKMMLPLLDDIVKHLSDGPDKSYEQPDGTTFTPPPLLAMFTNDGQINQMAAVIGVFDNQKPLPSTYIPANRTFRASNFVTMRGTITFERLNCSDRGVFVRLALNDVVYPVVGCQDGPGRSCPLKQYQDLVHQKSKGAGDFIEICNVTNSPVAAGSAKTTFLEDLTIPWATVIKP